MRCLLQTPNRYLWIGTSAGLARFDGLHFTVFNRDNTPQMDSDNCTDLAADAQGWLWVGTDHGLLRWKNHQFTALGLEASGLSHESIRYLRASPRGGMWISTENGLHYYHEGKFTRYTTADGLQANNLRLGFADSRHRVWVATEIEKYKGGFQMLDSHSERFANVPGQGTDLAFMTHSITENPLGHVWWGNNRGLHEIYEGQIRDYTMTDGLSGPVVKFIAPSRDGGLWILTGQREDIPGRRGLHRFKDGKCVRLEFPDAGIEDDVICALDDREGNVWVGTRHDGVIQLQPRRTVSFSARDGLAGDAVRSVCEGMDGSIWVGTDHLNRIKDGSVFSYEDSEPLRYRVVGSVLADHAGNVWVGRDMGGVLLLPGGRATSAWIEAGAYAQTIFGLFEDRDHYLWISASDGVFRQKEARGPNDQFFRRPALSSHIYCAILQDKIGRMWLGTLGGGIFRFHQGKSDWLTATNGLSSDKVLSFYEEPNGAVWIGTDRGLNRCLDGQFRSVSTREGLFDNRINSILEDDFGFFWIGCNHGIYKVSRAELNAAADGRTNQVHCVVLGESDGLPSSQTSSERQPVACKSRDGRLWFGTAKGVVAIDPKTINQNDTPPPVVIERVIADGVVIYGDGVTGPSQTQLRLAAGRARVLKIFFTANTFTAPERVRFQYRLEGEDHEWHDDDGSRVATYTELRPGEFRFHVKASNSHGYWSEPAAPFVFSLSPHFYETWAFYLACGLAVIGVAAGMQSFRLRLQQRILGLQQQAALGGERARIAQDMHDDLGASLTNIALLGEVVKQNINRTDLVQTEAEKISTIASGLVDNLGELVWVTNPKYDSLPDLVSYLREKVGSFFEDDSIRCHLEFPSNVADQPLPGKIRRNLYLVVKEALHNVLKHAGATEVWVRVRCTPANSIKDLSLPGESAGLEIEISDNGHGFDVNGRNSGLHHGLDNMRQRLAELNGTCDIQSEPGQGTHIYVRINLA